MPIYTNHISDLATTATNFTFDLGGANFPNKVYVAVHESSGPASVTVTGYNNYTGLFAPIAVFAAVTGSTLSPAYVVPPQTQRFKVEAISATLRVNLLFDNDR